jgi:hypothetical protein
MHTKYIKEIMHIHN